MNKKSLIAEIELLQKERAKAVDFAECINSARLGNMEMLDKYLEMKQDLLQAEINALDYDNPNFKVSYAERRFAMRFIDFLRVSMRDPDKRITETTNKISKIQQDLKEFEGKFPGNKFLG